MLILAKDCICQKYPWLELSFLYHTCLRLIYDTHTKIALLFYVDTMSLFPIECKANISSKILIQWVATFSLFLFVFHRQELSSSKNFVFSLVYFSRELISFNVLLRLHRCWCRLWLLLRNVILRIKHKSEQSIAWWDLIFS